MYHSAVRPSVLTLLKSTVAAWTKDRALNLSAALAYYSIFSIAPLLIIAISIAGLIFGGAALQGRLDDQLKLYIGAEAARGVQTLIKSASKPGQGWIGATVGFLTLLVGASGVFGQLKESLNTVWSVQAKPGAGWRGLVRDRLLSFGMVLVIGFLLLVSLVLSSVLAGTSAYLNSVFGLPTFIWAVLSFLLSLGVVTVLFALIFKVLPDANVEWRDVWAGAVATALLFDVGKFGLSFYLGRESTASSFGAAGSVILLLLWIYYASAILLFGAEFTRVEAAARGRVIVPTAHAEPAHEPSPEPEALPERREPARETILPPIAAVAIEKPKVAPSKKPSLLGQLGKAVLLAGTSFLAGRLFAKKRVAPAESWDDAAARAGEAIAAAIQPRQKSEPFER